MTSTIQINEKSQRNTVISSILFRSKNVRKDGALIFIFMGTSFSDKNEQARAFRLFPQALDLSKRIWARCYSF